MGRRDYKLQESKELAESKGSGVFIETHTVDVTSLESVQSAATAIGQWDVLVSNAGYITELKPLVNANVDEWWMCFEVRTALDRTDLV